MKMYWLLQLAGWGIFLLCDTLLKLIAGIFTLPLFYAVAILYGYGLLVSHGMRVCYQRWQQWHLLKVIAGVVVLSLLGGATATCLMLGTLIAIQHPIIDQATGSLDLLFASNAALLWAVFLIWSGLYFFITRQRKVNELQLSQSELQQTLQQVQLSALLIQLNPHFMFNCINNIRALILEDANKARDMLANMADMLRYNLQTDAGETATLAAELHIVKTYISLMKMQYEARLRYKVTLENSILEQSMVPRMLLQLLVENAIKHGIATQAEGGCVTIDIRTKAQMLVLSVSNPGVYNPSEGGIGINNIRQRLTLLYGNNHHFILQQEQHKVVAQIQLPLSTHYAPQVRH